MAAPRLTCLWLLGLTACWTSSPKLVEEPPLVPVLGTTPECRELPVVPIEPVIAPPVIDVAPKPQPMLQPNLRKRLKPNPYVLRALRLDAELG